MGPVPLPVFRPIVRRLGAALVAGTILYYSVVPFPATGTVETGPFGLVPLSYWLHFLAYAALAGSTAYARFDDDRRRIPLVFLGVVAFGFGIEVVQHALPDRTFSLLDVAVNAGGGAAGLLLWLVLLRIAEPVPSRP